MCTHNGTLIAEVTTMVNTISVRELRPKLSQVIDNIHKRFDRYVITRRGKPEVVMMSIDDYEGLLETLEIESDPELMADIRQAEEDMKNGKGKSLEQIHKELGIV
jgi:prevent-host-death family protein